MPGRRSTRGARALEPRVGRPGAGGQDHDVGRGLADRLGRRRHPQPHVHAEAVQLPLVPREVVEDLRARRLAPGEDPLPAEAVASLDQDDGVAPLGRHPRRLEAGRPAADDEHGPGPCGRREAIAAPLVLPPGRGVDQARDPVVPGAAPPAQLVAGDARPDPVGVSGPAPWPPGGGRRSGRGRSTPGRRGPRPAPPPRPAACGCGSRPARRRGCVTCLSAAANGSPRRGGYSDGGMIVKKSK